MPFERRLAAALVLLLGIIPVMSAFLPAHPEALVAPLAVLVCTGATVVALRQRVATVAASGLGALTLVAFAAWAADAPGLGYTVIVPLALMLAGAPAWAGALGLLVAAGLAVGLGGAPSGPVVGFGTLSDLTGLMALVGWAAWIVGRGVRVTWLRRDLDELHTMADTLEAGISRDAAQLWAVARNVADAGLTRVRGQGLDDDGLNLATSLPDGAVLAARIEGDPLATLTVGHALRACAAAGVRDPDGLRRVAATQLDEVNDPDDLLWVALYDADADAWTSSPADLCQRRLRQGRLIFKQRLDRRQTRTTLIERMKVAPMVGAPSKARVAVQVVAIAVLLPLSAASALLGPIGGSLPLVVALIAHALMAGRHRAASSLYEASEGAVDDRIDCRDDIHHGLARMLGGLLPYQVACGRAVATAHRLRGDVIGGSFADMLVDDAGKIRVLAGEVAGEGIGAGFLSIAAQMALRNLAPDADTPWTEVVARTEALVQREATVLKYPLRLELGMVVIDGGSVRGLGCLDKLLVHEPGSETTAVVDEVELREDATVYVTPGTSRAGPEDDAPTVDRAAVGGRLAEVLRDADGPELPSLFSEVFDGQAAPAHGTLIELRIDTAAAAAATLASSPLGQALGGIVVDTPTQELDDATVVDDPSAPDEAAA